MPPYKPMIERFSEKYTINPTTNCWEWKGSVSRGYGYLGGRAYSRTEREPNVLVHRLSYQHFIGPIPDDKLVLHSCNNSLCVNPQHLRLGTHRENMNDLVTSGRAIGRPKKVRCSLATPSRYTTAAERAEILKLLDAGMPVLQIAQQLGFDRKTIRNIRDKAKT